MTLFENDTLMYIIICIWGFIIFSNHNLLCLVVVAAFSYYKTLCIIQFYFRIFLSILIGLDSFIVVFG